MCGDSDAPRATSARAAPARRSAAAAWPELGRRARLAHAEPGAIDAGRERIDAEILHRAEIAERLHQRECDAGHDRGTRQRQRDMRETLPRRTTERAADLDRADRLVDERDAREQIDIR